MDEGSDVGFPLGERKERGRPTAGLVAVSGDCTYHIDRSRGEGEREGNFTPSFAQGELDNWRRSGGFQMQSKHTCVCLHFSFF